jgi:hypothetical protein
MYIKYQDFTIHKFVNGKETQKYYIITLDVTNKLLDEKE